MAKISLVGKVLERNKRKGKDNVDRFTIVVEEPGQYPNEFAFMVKDPAALGPSDGFAKIGSMVQVTGYLNGKSEMLQRCDSSLDLLPRTKSVTTDGAMASISSGRHGQICGCHANHCLGRLICT